MLVNSRILQKGRSGIYIKPKNRGKFTASAKRAGHSVQEHARAVLNNPNATPLQKKRANFARNAAKWNKQEGGLIGGYDPEMLYRDRFNTELNPIEQGLFNQWVEQESKRRGRNILMDKGTYDLQGFWKYDKQLDQDQHGSDKWKKPNHPKFSDESIYHRSDGFYGGKWKGDAFQPSKQTLELYGEEGLKRYFNEPHRPEYLDLSRFESGKNAPSPLVRKKGGKLINNNTMAKKILVPLNDLLPFRRGGMLDLEREGLPQGIGPGERPDRLIPLRGKTLSRKADELPVRSRKVNAYNYKKGKPYTKLGRLKKRLLQDGGIVAEQDTTNPNRFVNPPQEVVGPPMNGINFETNVEPVPYDPSAYEQFMLENYVPYSDHPQARNVNGVPVENPPVDPRTRKTRFQDGGVILSPSGVRENLPQLSNEQLAELSQQMFSGQQQGVVSDTIRYNIPEYDPAMAGSQQRVPIEFTTPNLNFETEGVPRGLPADRRQAPILGGRRKGGRMKKGCGGKIKMR